MLKIQQKHFNKDPFYKMFFTVYIIQKKKPKKRILLTCNYFYA